MCNDSHNNAYFSGKNIRPRVNQSSQRVYYNIKTICRLLLYSRRVISDLMCKQILRDRARTVVIT